MSQQPRRQGSPALTDEIERQRALDEMKKDLVGWAEELARQAPPSFASQLSLAQEAAGREGEPAVLKNFLRYQAARGSNRDPGWRHNDLYKKAAEHFDRIDQRSDGDSRLRQQAISLYLGYLRRSYVAERLLDGRRQ